jgi:hypothetical protein
MRNTRQHIGPRQTRQAKFSELISADNILQIKAEKTDTHREMLMPSPLFLISPSSKIPFSSADPLHLSETKCYLRRNNRKN